MKKTLRYGSHCGGMEDVASNPLLADLAPMVEEKQRIHLKQQETVGKL